jgi:uncharacterized damage-inducible protein DinB
LKASNLPEIEYPKFYKPYIVALKDLELDQVLIHSKSSFLDTMSLLKEADLNFRYAEGKWSVAELIIHIIDTERIFQYRVLRLARNDKTQLPGFEQDDYINFSNAENRTLESLIREFEVVRDSSILLQKSLTQSSLEFVGKVSGGSMSVRAILFMLAGHVVHHEKILRERYLNL